MSLSSLSPAPLAELPVVVAIGKDSERTRFYQVLAWKQSLSVFKSKA